MRSILPPKPPSTEFRWYAVSVFVHAVLLGLLVWVSTHTRSEYGVTHFIQLYDTPDEQRQFSMRFSNPTEGGVTVGETEVVWGTGPLALVPARSSSGAPTARLPVMQPESLTIGIAGASNLVPGAVVVGTRRPIGPALADGRVWVERELYIGDTEQGWGEFESELAMRVAAMLENVIVDSLLGPGMPNWVYDIGGQEWGIDSRFIHLGPVKIPTMLLGLLPAFQQGGNYELAQQAKWLADVRDQIVRQAASMDGMETFRRGMAELRARKDLERREQRRRDLVAGRDSVGQR